MDLHEPAKTRPRFVSSYNGPREDATAVVVVFVILAVVVVVVILGIDQKTGVWLEACESLRAACEESASAAR